MLPTTPHPFENTDANMLIATAIMTHLQPSAFTGGTDPSGSGGGGPPGSSGGGPPGGSGGGPPGGGGGGPPGRGGDEVAAEEVENREENSVGNEASCSLPKVYL